MSTHLARRVTVGLAATAASAGMLLAAGAPAGATAGATTTNFNNACWAAAPGNVAQVEPASVTVNHTVVAPAGSENTYTIQFGSQTTPSTSPVPLYTFTGLSDVRYKLNYNTSTLLSATKSTTGTNITGSPTVAYSGGDLTLGTFSVAPSTTFTPPEITVKTNSPVFDVVLATSGTAAQFGNYADNYFHFKSNGRALGLPANANTSCIPANGPVSASDVGNYPTLNAGAGTLH